MNSYVLLYSENPFIIVLLPGIYVILYKLEQNYYFMGVYKFICLKVPISQMSEHDPYSLPTVLNVVKLLYNHGFRWAMNHRTSYRLCNNNRALLYYIELKSNNYSIPKIVLFFSFFNSFINFIANKLKTFLLIFVFTHLIIIFNYKISSFLTSHNFH